MRTPEQTTARAVARALTLNARQALTAAERALRAAGDTNAADTLHAVSFADALAATYDGEPQAFACKR